MSKAVKPVPEGFHSVNPYLIVSDADALHKFMGAAFGAVDNLVMRRPDGSVGHAQVIIGDSMVEFAQAGEQWKPMVCALHLYVPDTDTIYKKALQAGGSSLFEPVDMFYGERSGGVIDPAGNHWYIATHTEDLTLEELQKRAAAQGKA